MTTPTEPAPTPATALTDQVLLDRARTTADVLTGLITAGLLNHAGQPQHLPTLLWPDTDPATVTSIWNAAAATGYYAGTLTSGNRWRPEHLDQARDALRDAGYTGMSRAVEAAAYVAPSRHRPPAPVDDPNTARPHPNTSPGADR